MAKKKQTSSHKSKDKNPSPLEEVVFGLEVLHARVAQVEDLKNEGFPYRDALRARAEIQMRESIRNVFGERSQEYQRLKQFRIQSTSEGDIAHALIILQDLILLMEERRMEILGISPATDASDSDTVQGTSHDTYQGASSPPSTPPIFPDSIHPPFKPISQPLPESPTTSLHPPVSTPLLHRGESPTPIPQETRPTEGGTSKALHVDIPLTPATSSMDMNLPGATTPRPSVPAPANPSPPSLESAFARVRVIANRFHAVARHLRHRRDYRTTLEVEDQYDVQDLFVSLLKVDFEEVDSEEWTPDYGGFSSQSTFFLAQGALAIILKKTRPGWGPRELISELTIDSARYATYPACKTLFCFVYDPEGRIGNPASLEELLTTHEMGLSLSTLISPK